MNNITVLLVKPKRKPEVVEIEDTLESLQKMVSGKIEVVYPFDDPVGLIMNEEGKLLGLTPNRALKDNNGRTYDIIFGDFLVTGLTEENFGSLSNELIEKIYKIFLFLVKQKEKTYEISKCYI